MLRLGTRSAKVPTVVAWLEDDTTVVGTAAEQRSLTEPARVAQRIQTTFWVIRCR
ncbi:MAG: hypothetical protein R2710_22375 [Acidimicrobiales bacterium]